MSAKWGLAGVVAALALTLPSAAGAATLTEASTFTPQNITFGASLSYVGAPGELNRVSVLQTPTTLTASVTWFDRTAPIVVQGDPIRPSVQVINAYSTWGCDSVTSNVAQCAYFYGPICRFIDCDAYERPGFFPVSIDTADANDIVYAQDGTPEQIACGTGNDQAFVDATDTVAADCEVVSRS